MTRMAVTVEDVFAQVCDLPAAERAALLADLCAGHTDIRREVESLLGHHDAATEFLRADRLRSLMDDPAKAKLAPGSRVDKYTILRQLGSGGMGDVYAAEQLRPRRTVALKVVRPGLATARLVRLFEREVEALGRLSHPGIAQVFEAGVAEYGFGPQPFFAMELVEGVPLQEACDRARLGIRERIGLFARICDAVQHAHQRGVIHRDLKPGNVLITTDAVGGWGGAGPFAAGGMTPKVLDFGIARLEEPGGEHTTILGESGQIVGTLSYMSPEQFGGAGAVDTRADVYALGVMLFQLLAGRLPHDVSAMKVHEAVREVCDRPAPRLAEIDATLRGDLSTIVATALEKDRERRYASAADFAADLRRYLAGEPVLARGDSTIRQLSVRLKRYRATVLATAIAGLLVAVLALYSADRAQRETGARRTADAALRDANEQRAAAQAASESLRSELHRSRVQRGRLLAAAGDIAAAETLLWDEYRNADDALTRWALREMYLRAGCLGTAPQRSTPGLSACVGWDGTWYFGGDDGSLAAWDPAQREERAIVHGAHERGVTRVRAAGRRILSGGFDGMLREWEPSTLNPLASIQAHEGPVREIAVRNNGALATIGGDGTVRIWPGGELTSPRELFDGASAGLCLAFNAAGDRLAAGYSDSELVILDVESGEVLHRWKPHPHGVASVAWSPDGATLAVGGADRLLSFWRTGDWTRIDAVSPSNGTVRTLEYTADGSRLLAGGWWRCDVYETAPPFRRVFTFPGAVTDVKLDQSGQALLSTGAASLRMWSLSPPGLTTIDLPEPAAEVAVSGDGRLLAVGGVYGAVQVRDASSLEVVHAFAFGARVRDVCFDPSGERLIVGGDRGDFCVYRLGTGEERWIGNRGAYTNSVAINAAGTRLYTGSRDRAVRAWDPDTGEMIDERPGSTGEILVVRLNRDETHLAVVERYSPVRFVNPAALATVHSEHQPDAAFWRGAFSPDGARFAGGTWRPAVDIVEVASGTLVHSSRGHTQLIGDVAYSGDGAVLFSGSMDGLVKVWDASTGEELATFDAGGEIVMTVAVLDGGARVVAGGTDSKLRIWDIGAIDRAVAGQAAGTLRAASTDPSR